MFLKRLRRSFSINRGLTEFAFTLSATRSYWSHEASARRLWGYLADVPCRRWLYTRVHQVGSHIVLETSEPTHHRIAIPDHRPLRIGTFSSILCAVAAHKGVTRDAIIADL
jgi:hypothetical protein